MGFSQQFYDAGHKYGFDNIGASASLSLANQKLLGTAIDSSTSWTGDLPPIGQAATVSIVFSGGFTATVGLTLSSPTSGVVSSVSYMRTDTKELVFSIEGTLQVNALNYSMVLQDQYMYSGNDTIKGNSFNNALKGYAGNDVIDGGAGTDTAYFSGLASQYQVTKNGTTMTVNGPDGTDTLLNIERLRFDDKAMAYDISGNGGQAYRLYQAAFNRAPDSAGLGFQMNALDSGWSLAAVAKNFIDSPEFSKTYGSLDNTQFVTQLYANVLHRKPDDGGLAYHVNNLEHGFTRADVLVGFSESPENQAALIGVIGNGFSYIPYG